MGFHDRIIEDYGVPLTSQKIVPGNTRTAISTGAYQYVERTLAYTSGGTTEIVAGDVIVGATSAAQATVKKVVLSSGTWAGGDAAGTFTLCNQIGTFQSENVKVGAGTNDATVGGNSTAVSTDYRFKNSLAKVAVVQAIAQNILLCFDGSTPDQTLLKGWTLHAGEKITVLEEAIQRITVVDRVSGSAGTVFIQCYF